MPVIQKPIKSRRSRTIPTLPALYYHKNFCEMLAFIEARYDHILRPSHKQTLLAYYNLPRPAQCLYARMAGRKGRVFDWHRFDYSEISDIPDQIETLHKKGFIGQIDETHYEAFLSHLTKPKLLSFLTQHSRDENFKASWNKGALIESALTQIPFEPGLIRSQYVTQLKWRDLDYILYLYFGKITENMQAFTLRDLGLIKTPDFKDDYDARFETRFQAEGAYFYDRELARFKSARQLHIENLASTLDDWPKPECGLSEMARDKLIFKIGQSLERSKHKNKALAVYEKSDAPECNERVIRIRYSEGEKSWVEARLRALIDNPASDGEYYFTTDFYQRKYKKKRRSQVTSILQSGDTIKIDELYKNTPELAAKHYYSKQNYKSYFTENGTWRMLFGLLFWEELFSSKESQLFNSFERKPVQLITSQFYRDHKTAIESKINNVSNSDIFFRNLLKTYTQNYGIPNSIFRWNKYDLDKLKQLIHHSSPQSLTSFMRLMAKDYANMKDGFPDLMLTKGEAIRFIEVKAEGDVIRRNQLTRIKQLQKSGFDCEIARIKWQVDPDQVYVVIDVETTGGRKGNHRVTEIGAVKIQGGGIIDTWQSLINPQRHIPKFIQTLTGINNDMVASAPLFSDIADEFAEFMGDYVFAAHNVNFDYGFISREYQRLDQKFIAPKICTCSSMRKYFPGRKSYSLKNLCQDFDIDLTSHHRALCDARAAAQLLIMVNGKRLAAQNQT